jgi:alpha-1,6-mannosyltransferase
MTRPKAFWSFAAIGTLSSAAVAVAGPRLVDRGVVTWWYTPSIGGARVLLYVGMVAMCVAWLGLGRARGSVRQLWVVAVLWCLPVALGPALFSRDAYSYLAQGEILHLGLSPYHDAPAVLALHGQRHLLSAVSPFWRHTTAPYGPLFLGIVSPISGATAHHLVAGVLLVRLLELVGVALLAAFAPLLARALGSDPSRAVWLGVLSPLVLLQLVAASHNDMLMAGLMVAGVLAAVKRRPLAAVALCAVAATIKVPAFAAIGFIVAAALRDAPGARERVRLIAGAAGITAVVLVAVSAATGVGPDWITTGVFSTPQKVRIAITPSTAVGYTVASLLHDAGAGANARSIEGAFADVTAVLVVAVGVALLWRVRRSSLVRDLGLFLVVAAVGGPAAWPCYLIWGGALLAACLEWQRSVALAAALTLPVFLVKPDGILLLDRSLSPAVLVVYLVLAAAAWQRWRHRRPAPAVAVM